MTRQWDNGTHGTPPAGVNLQRLRPYLQDALRHQKDKRTALAIAQRLDRNQWRAIAQFDVVGDDHDRVDLDSFSIRVEVEVSDGWAELCTVHWTHLGMEWSDVTAAWDEVRRQHREGIQPGGPNDLGRRDEPTTRYNAWRSNIPASLPSRLKMLEVAPCRTCSTSSGSSGPPPAPRAMRS